PPPRTMPSRVTMSLGTPTLSIPPLLGCPAGAGVGTAAGGAGAETETDVAAGVADGAFVHAATSAMAAPEANSRNASRRFMIWAARFRLAISNLPQLHRGC